MPRLTRWGQQIGRKLRLRGNRADAADGVKEVTRSLSIPKLLPKDQCPRSKCSVLIEPIVIPA